MGGLPWGLLFKGDTKSLDYSSYGAWGSGFRT